MGELAQMRCTACRGYEPTLTEAEIEELLPRVPDRQLAERAFGFDDFAGALASTNSVGERAEEAGHHPVLLPERGGVTVAWWTHKIGGRHRNDFVMAAGTDQTFGG